MDKLEVAIYRADPLSAVKDLLSRCHRDDLEDPTIQLDMLHHAILANNWEVVELLFLKGHYLHPYREDQLPYLHLACLCGNSAISATILEFRPNDFQRRPTDCFKWDDVERILTRNTYDSLAVTREKFEEIKQNILHFNQDALSPIDVAGIAGHIKCVKSLLSTNASRCTLKSVLERAVEANSPAAVKLILQHDSVKQQDINMAFVAALRRKQSHCLGICLEFGNVDVSSILHDLSPYHVLYMYSSAFQIHGPENRNLGMSECTRVLIKHNIDVGVKEPIGSYPLYSLIASLIHEKDTVPNKIPAQHISCLEQLLVAGADPNFDEVAFSHEKSHGDFELQGLPTIGRDLFASALHAFFISLQASDTWRPHLAVHLDLCCLKLLEHGADPTYINPYGDAPLHDLMKVAAMQHAMGHMHADVGTMCRMLLYFGADPNQTSTNGLYAVHYYFPILVTLMGGRIAFNRWSEADNTYQVMQLLYYMDVASAVAACDKISACLIEAKADGVPDKAVNLVRSYMVELVYKPKTLQELCKLVIWQSVGRKSDNLKLLGFPKSIVKGIKDIFLLDIDYR